MTSSNQIKFLATPLDTTAGLRASWWTHARTLRWTKEACILALVYRLPCLDLALASLCRAGRQSSVTDSSSPNYRKQTVYRPAAAAKAKGRCHRQTPISYRHPSYYVQYTRVQHCLAQPHQQKRFNHS